MVNVAVLWAENVDHVPVPELTGLGDRPEQLEHLCSPFPQELLTIDEFFDHVDACLGSQVC